MKKQFLCLLLALVLTVGLLPVTALADTAKPEAKFDFILSGAEIPEDTEAALVMNAGDEPRYYATKQSDPAFPNNYYLSPGTETEWNVKFAYPAVGIPTVTLKDAKIINKFGLWFGGIDMPMTSDVKVVVEGTNQIEYVSGTDQDLPLYGALILHTTGTSTIAGPGKLNITSDHHYYKDGKSVNSGALACDGDLILENVELFISLPESKGKTNGICTTGGNVTMKGGSLTLVSYDDPETTHDPGSQDGYRRNQETMHSAVSVKKTEGGEGGNFTVQDGAKVLIMGSPCKSSYNNGHMIYTEGTFIIKDSTVELGLVGKTSSVYLFGNKPTLEFKDNTYTISATKTKPEYTHGQVAITPKEDKLVDYLSDDVRAVTLTYFKVAPGGPGGPHCELPPEEPPVNVTPPENPDNKDDEPEEPEEPQPTEPQPTEPAPTEPAPTEPAPTESQAATQPAGDTTQPSQTPAATQQPDNTTPTEKDSGNGLLTWVIVICSVLIAGCGFALYWFVFRKTC